jgi:hypothetical protein
LWTWNHRSPVIDAPPIGRIASARDDWWPLRETVFW